MKKKKMVAVNVCAEILRCIRLIGGIVLIMASPFAWILRDGLGPNAHATTGFKAVVRTLSFCNIWMLAVALIVISIAIRFMRRWNDVGQQKAIAKKGLVVLVIVVGAISIAVCALLMCFDRPSSTSERDLVKPANPVKR